MSSSKLLVFGLKRCGVWVVWIVFAFVLFYSGAWLHWALRLAPQAQESIRRVANQLRLVVLSGRLLLLRVLQSAALRLQFQLQALLSLVRRELQTARAVNRAGFREPSRNASRPSASIPRAILCRSPEALGPGSRQAAGLG